MTIWVDAQLPPAVAAWIGAQFGVTAVAPRDSGLRDSTDRQIFTAAGPAAVTNAPLREVADDPSRLLVTFLGEPAELTACLLRVVTEGGTL